MPRSLRTVLVLVGLAAVACLGNRGTDERGELSPADSAETPVPASRIQGEFLGTTGRPQPERQVDLLGDHFRAVGKTDSDGRFEFGGVPPGEFFLYAAMENETEIQQRVVVAKGETVHVRLAPPPGLLRMHGTVQIGGARVADAEVSARVAGEGGKGSATSVFTDTDAEGAYELALPGPGVYELSIIAAGKDNDWLDWSECLDLPSVETLLHDVAIPVGRISGRVTDATGRALAGVEIRSEPEPRAAGPSGSAITHSDDKGRYELSLPAGGHSIFASGLRMPEARVDGLEVAENATLEGIDFVIAAGGLVSGRVSNADGTVASYARIWSREGARLAMSDENGRFELGLGAGLHSLAAHSRTGVTREFAEVDVSVGSTTSIDLVLAPARLVYLSIRQGRLPVAARVELRDSHGQPQPVEPWEGGEAWLGPLVPGRYTVRAERYTVRAERDGKRAERAFEVTSAKEPMELSLVFE
jgi:carboxypeptidase family protein